MSQSGPASRLPFVDAVKAIGSQLIVLHHLAFYGPMAAAAHELAPGLIDWLADYARIAVQAFLVVGGFLAARSLAPDGVLAAALRPPRVIVRRYLRLVLPLAGAIALALACAAIARRWMTDDAIPAPPGLLAGMAVAGKLDIPLNTPAFVISRDALTLRRDQWFVFAVADGKARQVQVELVADMGETVAIYNDALRPGQDIVVRGGDGLRDGAMVKIVGNAP